MVGFNNGNASFDLVYDPCFYTTANDASGSDIMTHHYLTKDCRQPVFGDESDQIRFSDLHVNKGKGAHSKNSNKLRCESSNSKHGLMTKLYRQPTIQTKTSPNSRQVNQKK